MLLLTFLFNVFIIIKGAQSHIVLYSVQSPSSSITSDSSPSSYISCVRHLNRKDSEYDGPLRNLTSTDMTCGSAPTSPSGKVCPVSAGSRIHLLYGHPWPVPANTKPPITDVIAPSHIGPCVFYLKKIKGDHSSLSSVSTDGFFKIHQDLWTEKDEVMNRIVIRLLIYIYILCLFYLFNIIPCV